MKTSILSFALLFSFSHFYAQESPAAKQTYQESANQLLDDAIAAGQFAGVTAGFAIDGDIKWMGSAGHCDSDRTIDCTPSTRNRIASISKTMTAVAALQLYERGLLDLDLPISNYLPDYPTIAANKITTRQLLHHTAGIGGYASGKETETPQEFASLADACKVFQDRDLLFEPGERYHYSTYGYVIIGRVIEATSGLSFEEYVQEHIFDKVQMTNSGVEHFSEEYAHKSAFFTRTKKGKIKSSKPNNLSNRVPGGGIYSNVEDMLKFGQALLDGTLLQDSTFQLMQIAPDVERGQNNPYGMGLFLYGPNPQYGPLIGHSGEQTGAAAQLMILPQEKIVVIVLSNTAHAWHDAVQLSVQLFSAAGAARE